MEATYNTKVGLNIVHILGKGSSFSEKSLMTKANFMTNFVMVETIETYIILLKFIQAGDGMNRQTNLQPGLEL